MQAARGGIRALAGRAASRHSTAPVFFCRSFSEHTHTGSCPCGGIHLETEGKPDHSAVCHCSNCLRIHSAPSVDLTGYKPESALVAKGEDKLLK
eukprot:CAMPEP_0180437788 /NCGR_PEP_ID=MMETSP1036_2-20121128/11730_1 /TAXON_ID=632150 /ORGANISM="Azadinium spinosum, Strain 3D9" /LENGTH=93 /DNA_ID=CAMNT_0022443861 /DNA_START=51 /DNA_END=332 /DNA_ORIENTATION=-